jgi:mannose-1-phosphate guanylyltransferase
MSVNYYAVIMAGGGGTRLWPLSRNKRPKQMLQLLGERTLFQVAVDRIAPLFSLDKILVVTTSEQAVALHKQYPEIPQENFITEPAPRGTASAIGLTAAVLKKRDPSAVMAVLTADHFIEHEDRFIQVLKAAEKTAMDDYLVTLGIHPTFPATGFGYIQQGGYLNAYEEVDVFHAEGFKEKPDLKTAKKLVEGEDHSWNSGMFIWRVEKIMAEFQRQMPDLYAALEEIGAGVDTPKYDEIINRVWLALDNETIDYGIMEGAEKVAVIPAKGLGWNDVGSWNALFDVLPADKDGNIVDSPEYININSQNNLIHLNGKQDRLIVTIGVQDLVIVDTGDVLLICHKDQAQDVRQVVNLLKEKNDRRYL